MKIKSNQAQKSETFTVTAINPQHNLTASPNMPLPPDARKSIAEVQSNNYRMLAFWSRELLQRGTRLKELLNKAGRHCFALDKVLILYTSCADAEVSREQTLRPDWLTWASEINMAVDGAGTRETAGAWGEFRQAVDGALLTQSCIVRNDKLGAANATQATGAGDGNRDRRQTGWFSASELANKFDVPFDALRKCLVRWRRSNGAGWMDNPDQGQNPAKVLYDIAAVKSVIDALKSRETRRTKTSAKRPSPPPKKAQNPYK